MDCRTETMSFGDKEHDFLRHLAGALVEQYGIGEVHLDSRIKGARFPQKPRHPRKIRMTPLRRAALKVAKKNPRIASQIKSAIRKTASPEKEDLFGVGGQREVDKVKRMIMRQPLDSFGFMDLYKGPVSDIELYLALAQLVREGRLSGPDPYRDRNWSNHRDLTYTKVV